MKTLLAGYDLNSDGRVTVKEFRRIMVRTGKMSDGDIEKMIEKADVDNDGCINFREFKKMFQD